MTTGERLNSKRRTIRPGHFHTVLQYCHEKKQNAFLSVSEAERKYGATVVCMSDARPPTRLAERTTPFAIDELISQKTDVQRQMTTIEYCAASPPTRLCSYEMTLGAMNRIPA